MATTLSLKEKVSNFIDFHSLLTPGAKVLVAVSGGSDSIFLLNVLHDLGYNCEAMHCNYHLRGRESMRDEDFVRNFCDNLGVPLHKTDFNTVLYATEKGISIEMAARELRYEYFEQKRIERNAEAVAVGHHKDDNVETLLLNIVRGTGIAGVKGIQPKNGNIVRPLLCLSHEEITTHLHRNHIEYVTDSTNYLDVYNRNKIRLNIMPILRSINLAAADNMAITIENLGEAYKVYEQAIKQAVENCYTINGDTRTIDISKLQSYVSPRSVLHEILTPYGFTGAQENDILRATKNEPGRIFNAKQWRLLIDRSQIIIAPLPNDDANIVQKFRFASHSGYLSIDGLGQIKYDIVDNKDIEFNTSREFAYFDVDKMHGPLTIRTVHQGDTFIPFGLKGTKLLSDFMTDIKLNRFEKESQKVMCDGNDIAWVIGKRSSDIYRVDASTKKVLILELKK